MTMEDSEGHQKRDLPAIYGFQLLWQMGSKSIGSLPPTIMEVENYPMLN